MSYTLDESTRDVMGLTFKVGVQQDDCRGRPWKECDGHGPVREGDKGYHGVSKKPGERVLHIGDRNCYSWVYDWNGALALAERDGWGVSPEHRPANWESMTPRQQREVAVQRDFDFLKGWCDEEWVYAGLCVTLMIEDEDGELVKYEGPLSASFHDSLWGIEFWQYHSISYAKNSYIESEAVAMCEEIARQYHEEEAERQACEERDIVTVDAP